MSQDVTPQHECRIETQQDAIKVESSDIIDNVKAKIQDKESSLNGMPDKEYDETMYVSNEIESVNKRRVASHRSGL